MGSIYKRGRTYWVSVMVDGRRIRKSVGPSKKIAKLVLDDLEVKVAKRDSGVTASDELLKHIFQTFMDYSKTNHTPSTAKRYSNVITNFQMFLALYHPRINRPSQLSPSIVEGFKKFRRTVDPRTIELPANFPFEVRPNSLAGRTRTVNYEIKTIKSIFNFAIRFGRKRT